jgi:hypothetical protein
VFRSAVAQVFARIRSMEMAVGSINVGQERSLNLGVVDRRSAVLWTSDPEDLSEISLSVKAKKRARF